MKLTKKAIEKLVLPPKDKPYSKIFHDDSQRGLALRVTSNGVKTFIINRKINGKVFRMRIGRFGDDYTLDQARKRAATLLGQLTSGVNPVKQEKERSIQKLALRTAYDSYLKTRKTLKSKTKQDYNSIMKNIFSNWQEKPLSEITRQMVSLRHAEIGKKHEARANNAFKLLSAVFNVAIYQHADSESNAITDNPVQVLTQTRAWFKPKRRTRKIDHQQLPAWFKSVYGLRQQSYNCVERSVKYYLILILFTGLRKDEPSSAVWADTLTPEQKASEEISYLSLEEKIIFIDETKNGVAHTLPLSDYLYNLFKAYRKINSSRFVFPGRGGESPIKEVRKVINKIIAESKVPFTIHDLRRTFATMANEIGIPAYTIKRLLNHKAASSDVTAGYIVNDLNYLKEPVNRIAQYIVKIAHHQPE